MACFYCTFGNDNELYKCRCREESESYCAREYWDGDQIKLSESHAVCESCSHNYHCPDPTVKTMIENERIL